MESKDSESSVDYRVVHGLEEAGTTIACGVPCTLLAGILDQLSKHEGIKYVPVTREEEGVGVCAGAYLGGGRPVLLMQNSGLGNSLNALLSLTRFYKLGLLLVVGFRGLRGEEKVEAQIPMGDATEILLSVLGAESTTIKGPDDIPLVKGMALRAFDQEGITAVLLTPDLWKDI